MTGPNNSTATLAHGLEKHQGAFGHDDVGTWPQAWLSYLKTGGTPQGCPRHSRLARRAPRRPEMALLFPDGPLAADRRAHFLRERVRVGDDRRAAQRSHLPILHQHLAIDDRRPHI